MLESGYLPFVFGLVGMAVAYLILRQLVALPAGEKPGSRPSRTRSSWAP
jgi:hypothetical protein